MDTRCGLQRIVPILTAADSIIETNRFLTFNNIDFGVT